MRYEVVMFIFRDMNERMVGQLERMMGETQNEQAKQALADAIERMGR